MFKNILTIWVAIASYGVIADQGLKGNLGSPAKVFFQSVANGFGV